MPDADVPTPHGARRLLIVANVAWFFLSHRLPLARAARAAGYDVRVAAGVEDDAEAAQVRSEGFEFRRLGVRRSSTSPLSGVWLMREISSTVLEFSPNVVHLVSLKVILLGGLIVPRRPEMRIVAAFSGLGHVFTTVGLRAAMLRAFLLPLFRIALRGSRVVALFQNEDDRRVFTESGAIPLARTRVIRGVGVDLSKYRVEPLPCGRPLVVLPGRVLREKGVLEFAEAARILRADGVDADFAIAGRLDAENPSALTRDEVHALEADCGVRYLGHVDDVLGLYRSASIVCLPSYREGMPKALAEAAAMGRPIVATDVPGCREAVVPGANGLLVPARDGRALADALRRLLTDTALRRAMAEESRRVAEARFDERAIVAETLSLYA
jgi:glycosyltransferase involved in cell wall biosynthesis